ncbi:MAG: leucine--tRNA ligase [Deltaproteobacteria bacterium]|nr:MAG: leucine--tRNA ligase [Deltaproteobacteria bacterium]
MADEKKPYRYDATRANEFETKWQQHWATNDTFKQPNPGEPGFDGTKERFYCLDMFPYPSGAGLHVGHPEGYTATDIISRFKRMRGLNVLHPMGWDAFGLPAEQYAIQTGVHPAETTKKSIDNFRRQLQRFGFSYDWSREFGTIDEDYYRWTQWIFLEIYDSWFDADAQKARRITDLVADFEGGSRPIAINPQATEHDADAKARKYGSWSSLSVADQRIVLDSYRLAYVARQTVNWCPKLGTALANEEVIDGRSERGGFPVLRKPLEQWLFRITAYGDRLLSGLEGLDWPSSTKIKQTDWIGRSEGAECDFELEKETGGVERLRVYTTRPDTLFGATYMVVAPEHALVAESTDPAVAAYVEEAKHRSDLERQQAKDKTGVFTGLNAINPVNGKKIPIWVADYVLITYGTGAIMAVPGHDERDWQFAKKFGLDIVQVISKADGSALTECHSGDGEAMNSANDEVSLDGLGVTEAKARITAWLEDKRLGHGKVNYKLRDWLFSRQRYWGEPFPIVWDEDGHHHAIGRKSLPLTLPPLADYAPVESDDPQPLLAKATDWVTTTAGDAGVVGLPADAKVTRETNTMPGWAGSCWYFLRYADPKNDERLIGKEADAYWLGERGVDLYIGGAEHAVLHLLYARFWHKVLFDHGVIQSDEPFRKLFHQGMILSHAFQRPDRSLVAVDQADNVGTEDEPKWVEKGGEEVTRIVAKMSKSLKNVTNPDDIIAEYGADTFRLYEMYMGPLETSKPWNTQDIHGMYRFLQRAWRLLVDETTGEMKLRDAADEDVDKQVHRCIAGVTDDIERLGFNTAIAKMIELVNLATSRGGLTSDQATRFAATLAPFAPHLAEEIWEKLGHSPCVSTAPWPTWDPAKLQDDTVEIPVQLMGKVRSRITMAADASKDELEAAALADPKIKELIEGKTVRKVVVVPGRLVNIVAN